MSVATQAPATLPASKTSGIMDLALEMLTEARPTPGDLVDLPCGSGYLSVKAAKAGWRVVPCDLFPEAWAGGVSVDVVRADMNRPLPLETASADAAVCCEGIEHAENPWNVLRELRRVLRPGGHAVFSLPNTVDVRQRVRMLRRGYVSHYVPSVPSHVNPMGPFLLCHALLATGFTVIAVRSRRAYGGLLRLAAPLFRFPKECGLPDDVRRMLSHSQVLFGRDVVVLAETRPLP